MSWWIVRVNVRIGEGSQRPGTNTYTISVEAASPIKALQAAKEFTEAYPDAYSFQVIYVEVTAVVEAADAVQAIEKVYNRHVFGSLLSEATSATAARVENDYQI